MAIGDQVGLQAVQAFAAQLPGIEKFTDDERAALVAGIAGLISQAGDTVLKIEDAAIDRLLAGIALERAAICNYVDARLNGLAMKSTLIFPPAQPVPQAFAAKS